jgi:ribose transport system permease protein
MVIVRGLCLIITKGTPLSLFSLPAEFKASARARFSAFPM